MVDNSEFLTISLATETLATEVEEIANQLCKAIDGNFDFVVHISSENLLTQKLSMLINFVLDSARRSVKELKGHNEQLTQLENRKSEFVANISHELRTPLTLILGPLQQLIDNSQDYSAEGNTNLQMIQRNASRLYTLVNDLLDFNKIEAKSFTVINRPLQLKYFIQELVDDVSALAKRKNITIKRELNIDEESYVLIDKMMLEKIILNLFSNAVKFTPDGGEICINVSVAAEKMTLYIEDNGIGIPEEKMKDLFKRFYQVDTSATRKYSGTGIGLSLVKEFATLMNGTVSVERLAQGTKFIVTLPIEMTDKGLFCEIDNSSSFNNTFAPYVFTEKTLPANENTVTYDSAVACDTIIVAEDNPDLIQYIQQILHGKYNLISVSNGKEVLDVLAAQDVSLIITDMMMPEMDGLQLIQKLKQEEDYKYIPIIVMTANVNTDAMISSFMGGADYFLLKPFSAHELQTRIHSSLRIHNLYVELKESKTRVEDLLEKTKQLNKKLVHLSREAGIAELASSILHNVGNVLNSVNISTEIITKNLLKINPEKFNQLSKLFETLPEQQKSLSTDYLNKLIEVLQKNKIDTLKEIELLNKNINHIKIIIQAQQVNAKRILNKEEVLVNDLISDLVLIHQHKLENHHIEVIKELGENIPMIHTDRENLIVIFNNLILNAIDSIDALYEGSDSSLPENRKITLRTTNNSEQVSVDIIDSGIGFDKEQHDKLFKFGFTTKKKGNGFGLHSCADIIKFLGGYINANSDGINHGAVFTVNIPHNQDRLVNDD